MAGALALYERAAATLTQLLAKRPRDATLRRQLAATHTARIRVLAYLGRGREAEEQGTLAIALYRGLANEFPNSAQALEDLASTYVKMVTASTRFPDRSKAIQYAVLGRQSYERIVGLDTHAVAPRIGLADALSQESSAKLFLNDTAGAFTAAGEALRIREQLRTEFPGNRVVLEGLMFSYGRLGDITKLSPGPQGVDYHRTLDFFRKAWEIANLLAAQDPANQRAQLDLAISGTKLGEAYGNLGEDSEAVGALRQSLGTIDKLIGADRGNTVTQSYRMVNQARLGFHSMRLKQRGQAVAAYERAVQLSQPLIDAGDRGDVAVFAYVTAKVGLALDAAGQGDPRASTLIAEAVKVAEQSAAKPQASPRCQNRNLGHPRASRTGL